MYKRPEKQVVTIELPEELLERVRWQAEQEERPVADVLADAVQFYLIGKLYEPRLRVTPRVRAA